MSILQQHRLAASARRAPERARLRTLGSFFPLLFACSSTSFVSTWKAPGAQPLEARGSKVAAVVMAKSDVIRRAGEDRLAHEISSRGAEGIPLYRLVPEAVGAQDEARVRSALEEQNIKAVVVMRPVQVDKELVVNSYGGPTYGGYWGGYYGYGYGNSYGDVDVHTNTIVQIETLVYSLTQNRLLWGGQSKTTNPENIEELVAEVAEAAASELESAGLIAKR